MSVDQQSLSNRLLRAIPEAAFGVLAQHLDPVDSPKDFVFGRTGEAVDYVYFPESGIASVVVKSPEGLQSEAGLFGRDGFAPVGVLARVRHHRLDSFMQVGGAGHRVSYAAFVDAVKSNDGIAQPLHSFGYLLGLQTAYTSLSNAVHQVDERLARWLLMCHDRADWDEIPLTHEFVSLMLAVRRPSVTTALHILEGNRLIRSDRGMVTIRDRDGLEQYAADAYGVPEAEYLKLIGAMR